MDESDGTAVGRSGDKPLAAASTPDRGGDGADEDAWHVCRQLAIVGQARQVRLGIYDVAGRLIRTLIGAEQAAGRRCMVWDGRAGDGSRVSQGVYLLRLDSGPRQLTRKIVMLD